jgi:hypothetical protein
MLDRQGDLFGLSPPAEVPLEIVGLFEKFALELIASGIDRYSARAIFHRIRWHFHVEKGDREFKMNNNFTPSLSRWFMRKYPLHADFFETRNSPGEKE